MSAIIASTNYSLRPDTFGPSVRSRKMLMEPMAHPQELTALNDKNPEERIDHE